MPAFLPILAGVAAAAGVPYAAEKLFVDLPETFGYDPSGRVHRNATARFLEGSPLLSQVSRVEGDIMNAERANSRLMGRTNFLGNDNPVQGQSQMMALERMVQDRLPLLEQMATSSGGSDDFDFRMFLERSGLA